MVDKRSLRSSKKDSQDPPAEEEKPKPTRTRSVRSKKQSNKTQETETSGVEAETITVLPDPVASTSQSEDVVMENQSETVPEKSNEDVEMKNASEEVKEEQGKKEEAPKEDPTTSPLTVIKQNLQLLEKAVSTSDHRFTYRVLKMSNLRKNLSPEVLVQVIREVYPTDHPSVSSLLSLLDKESSSMEVDTPSGKSKEIRKIIPEGDAYIKMLTQLVLLDSNRLEEGAQFSTSLVESVHSQNRRTLDQIGAKIFFYYSRFYELLGNLASIRQFMLAALRTATLRYDTDTQGTLLTLLLRNFIHYKLYDQADKLVSRTTFPESSGNNLFARYLYYLGRIRAIQLDYSAAHTHLLTASRKAPQQNKAAAGFLQTVHKFLVVVELLMGDIPERSDFRKPMLEKVLAPYAQIVQAVRIGDLGIFNTTMTTYEQTFRKDDTFTLISRLRQNVIKTGLRTMSLTYSRISLRDVCLKLGLDSEETTEYIVAKAIRDGVIEATINHEGGFMQNKEVLDVYATEEPLLAFDERIRFCMSLHNEAIKAMRFPTKESRAAEDAEKLREREKELVKEIEDGDLDDDDDVGPDFGV